MSYRTGWLPKLQSKLTHDEMRMPPLANEGPRVQPNPAIQRKSFPCMNVCFSA
jgi:hypothetical protein